MTTKPEKFGPEDYLVLELLDVCQGRRPRSDAWKKDYGGRAYESGLGSGNWQPLKIATLYRNIYTAQSKLEVHGHLDNTENYLLNTFFPLQRKRFMLTELMSLIYGTMHLASVACIAQTALEHKHTAIATEAITWLRLYLSILDARQDSDGFIAVAGMRSAGHAAETYGDPWGARALSIATGTRDRESMAQLKAAGKGPRRAWEEGVLQACARALKEAGRDLTPPTGFTAVTGLHALKMSNGVSTWIDRNHNSNTAPEMVTVRIGGSTSTLPGDNLKGKSQIRRMVEAECEKKGDLLVGSYGGVNFHLILPGGKVIKEVHLKAAS